MSTTRSAWFLGMNREVMGWKGDGQINDVLYGMCIHSPTVIARENNYNPASFTARRLYFSKGGI
jgi:hypothetical protein